MGIATNSQKSTNSPCPSARESQSPSLSSTALSNTRIDPHESRGEVRSLNADETIQRYGLNISDSFSRNISPDGKTLLLQQRYVGGGTIQIDLRNISSKDKIDSVSIDVGRFEDGHGLKVHSEPGLRWEHYENGQRSTITCELGADSALWIPDGKVLRISKPGAFAQDQIEANLKDDSNIRVGNGPNGQGVIVIQDLNFYPKVDGKVHVRNVPLEGQGIHGSYSADADIPNKSMRIDLHDIHGENVEAFSRLVLNILPEVVKAQRLLSKDPSNEQKATAFLADKLGNYVTFKDPSYAALIAEQLLKMQLPEAVKNNANLLAKIDPKNIAVQGSFTVSFEGEKPVTTAALRIQNLNVKGLTQVLDPAINILKIPGDLAAGVFGNSLPQLPGVALGALAGNVKIGTVEVALDSDQKVTHRVSGIH